MSVNSSQERNPLFTLRAPDVGGRGMVIWDADFYSEIFFNVKNWHHFFLLLFGFSLQNGYSVDIYSGTTHRL